MNETQYVGWARPKLGEADGPAAKLFLSLPGIWARACASEGEGRFLESSASSREAAGVKLACIAGRPPAVLRAAADRDAVGLAESVPELLARLGGLGGRYDEAAARKAVELLTEWRLRASLMLSCDFDACRNTFGKLTLYGYVPQEAAAANLAAALSPGVAEEPGASRCGALEFWGLDLWPDGRRALKTYRRRPFDSTAVPARWALFASTLSQLTRLRDLTTLTRLGGGEARKIYLGLSDGVDPGVLARLPGPAEAPTFLRDLAREAQGQRVYFLGLAEDGHMEAYFDRRPMDAEPKGPPDDD